MIYEYRHFNPQVEPICLFGHRHTEFKQAHVAGFGSPNFGSTCWTNKDGPNSFMECEERFEADGEMVEVVNDPTEQSVILEP